MNPRGLSDEIWIISADNDSRVVRSFLMQSDEMLAVERQHGSLLTRCELQNGFIGDCLIGFPGFEDCQDIVAKTSQLFDHRLRKILVRVEPRHGSGILVLTNLLLDFLSMRSNIRPSVNDVFRSQRRINAQQFGFARSLPAGLFQEPDGNSGPDYARFTAADTGAAFDPRERIAQITDHPLNQLRFFRAT